MAKQKAKKGKGAVAKKGALAERKRELVFAGASSLMGVDPKKLGPAEVAAHKARTLVARALGIPPTAVVVLGNVPYVDNHGRKHLMAEYAPNAQFEYEYVQIAKDDTEKAIVKCRIVVSHGSALCGWVIGEASPATTRMGTLKGYQNHLAQTRAENRAFEAAFGNRLRKDLYEGVARELGAMKEAIADVGKEKPEVELALRAGNTSAEEAVDMRSAPRRPAVFDPMANARAAIAKAKSARELEGLRSRVKGSAHLKVGDVNKLLNEIDERLSRQFG